MTHKEDLMESPRHAEDGGSGECGAGLPSVDRAAAVSAAFPVEKAPVRGTTLKTDDYVDLESGYCAWSGDHKY